MEMVKKIQGGATIGSWRVPYFCSFIEIIDNHLILNASFLGYYVFDKKEILSIELYKQGFVKGIKINHKVKSYNDDIYFWPIKNTETIIKEIEDSFVYFQEEITIHSNINKENSGHLVIKKPVIFFIILMYFLAFINDVVLTQVKELSVYKVLNFNSGGGVFATSFTIVLSIMLLVSKQFRNLVLIKDYNFEYLRPFVYFILLMTLFVLYSLVFRE